MLVCVYLFIFVMLVCCESGHAKIFMLEFMQAFEYAYHMYVFLMFLCYK